jgi:hypothetical protein
MGREIGPIPVPEGARACYTGPMRLPRLSVALSLVAPAGMLVLGLLVLAGPAEGFVLLGSSWDPDDGPIIYSVNPAGSDDISDGSDLEAVDNAFNSWACVDGSRLRVLNSGEPGPDIATLEDGIQNVIWDETGEYGLGPAVLGVTVGDAPLSPDEPIIRNNADIIMNGFDHTWRTDTDGPADGVDAESVLVHEAGHFFGLGHPCTDEAETDCLGPDAAVMTPALPNGAIIRTPFEDDENGMREMYAQDEDDESSCTGPFRQGEPCACNDECVAGLKCTAGEGQPFPVCTPNCGSGGTVCPDGFSCVLAAVPDGQDSGEGACVLDGEDGAPPAAACERDSDCAEGICLVSTVVGRRICQVQCDSAADCPDGYACTEDICTGGGATDGITCPIMEPGDDMEMPACSHLDGVGEGAPWGLFALLPLLVLRRRRSTQR